MFHTRQPNCVCVKPVLLVSSQSRRPVVRCRNLQCERGIGMLHFGCLYKSLPREHSIFRYTLTQECL